MYLNIYFENSLVYRIINLSLMVNPYLLYINMCRAHGRQFYINVLHYGCPADLSYMLALSRSDNQASCNYDQQTTYPQFLYSKFDRPVKFESGQGVFT